MTDDFVSESARLVQISISNGGLPKLPVEGPQTISPTGVRGDRQRNLKYHGGPDKAVLMIAAEVVDALAARGFPVRYGSMGENLTVVGLNPHYWRSGQTYRVGSAEIQLTELRVPCANLDPYGKDAGLNLARELYDKACKTGDVTSPVWAHGGFYARVLRSGHVSAGAPVVLISDVA